MSTQIPQITATTICNALGRKAMADRLGVVVSAISNNATEGTFPAIWFDTVDDMCREAGGIPCPRTLFRFKNADTAA
jgi:hypothetical protein